MSRFRVVCRLPEFDKDLKRLKRYKSLADDLETFINIALYAYHKLKQDNRGIFPITGLSHKREHIRIFKAKKFSCKSLMGKGAMSGIRVIYAYNESEDSIDLIEIYYKDREDTECDMDRIKAYCEEE